MAADIERENRGHTARLVRNVWLGCFAFVAAFVGAVYLTVQFAGEAANDISTTRELQLVAFDVQRVADNAIAAQQRIVKSDQLFLETKKTDIDQRGFDRLIGLKMAREPFSVFSIIDGDSNLAYAETQFSVSAPKEKSKYAQRLITTASDLVQDVYQTFDEMKAPSQDGYVVPSHFLYDDKAMTVFAFRYFEGKLHLIVAQPILAMTSYMRIDSEYPFVSVAAIPIPNLFFSQTASQIGMQNLYPAVLQDAAIGKTSLLLPNGNLPSVALLEWDATSPKLAILQDATPYLIALLVIILVSTILVATKFASVLTTLGLVNRSNRFMARHCGLTNLANRSKFDELIDKAAKNCHAQPFTLLTIDLDKFKPLNDNYGHAAGDMILVEIAKRFQNTVGEFGTVARVGGDEFMVLLKQSFGRDITKKLARELVELSSWPISTPYGELSVGCSIGIANAPKDGRTAPDVMRRADEAMYHSKRQGGGRATFAEDRVTHEDAPAEFQASAG